MTFLFVCSSALLSVRMVGLLGMRVPQQVGFEGAGRGKCAFVTIFVIFPNQKGTCNRNLATARLGQKAVPSL